MALARIEAVNPSLNAFNTVVADRAMARAQQIDRDPDRCRKLGQQGAENRARADAEVEEPQGRARRMREFTKDSLDERFGVGPRIESHNLPQLLVKNKIAERLRIGY